MIKKRIYKYEPLNTNQDLVFEDPSNHGFHVELEKAIRNELNQKTKTIVKIKQIDSEPNHTTDGGSWIVTKQIRCYAPEDDRTIIIVRMNKSAESLVEPEHEMMDPGTIQHDNNQIN